MSVDITKDMTEYITSDEAHEIAANATNQQLIDYSDNQWSYVTKITPEGDNGMGVTSEDTAQEAWTLAGRWTAVAILHEERARRGL